MKPKPKKPLYVGRSRFGYEITDDKGVALVFPCKGDFELNVGKLKIGEVRRLYVRMGK